MKDDFADLRAERDDPFARPGSRIASPRKPNYTLQIALGIWLGGMALGITGIIAGLLITKLLPSITLLAP